MAKKWMSIGLTVAMAVSLASGVTVSADEEIDYSGRQELKYWYCWGGDSETWDQWRMDEFNKAQDEYYITGQYVPEGSGVNNGKLMAAIQSGDVPDVIVCDNSTAIYSLVAEGAFEPLDEAMETVGFDWESVNPAVLDLMKYDGQTYLYPTNTDTVLLFIRNDMAEAAGLDVTNPPKTIDELDAWAEAMTKINEDGSVDCYGFIPWLDDGSSQNWGVQFGASVYDAESDTYNVNTPEMVQIYEWMRSYSNKFDTDILMGFTSNLGGAFSPDHAFFTGDVAMTINGNWFCNAIAQYAPDIDYTIVPLPAISEDLYGGTPLTGNVIAAPKGSKNIEGAVAWANWCQTAEMQEGNNAIWLSLGIFPDSVTELSRYKANDPAELMVVDVTFHENSRFFCVSPKTALVLDGLKQVLDTAIYTNEDIGAALDAVNSTLN